MLASSLQHHGTLGCCKSGPSRSAPRALVGGPPSATRQMLKVARGYDRLAERAELVAGPAVGVAMRQGDSLMRSYATGKESPLTRTTHCKPPHEAGEAIPAHHRRIPSGLIRFDVVARIVAAIN